MLSYIDFTASVKEVILVRLLIHTLNILLLRVLSVCEQTSTTLKKTVLENNILVLNLLLNIIIYKLEGFF